MSNKKNTKTAEFSEVTPKQSKHTKPVDMEILNMIRQGDIDLTTFLNENLKKPEHQNKTNWFKTPETPKKTRIAPQYRHESSKN